jgi:hypothetical protein
MDLGKKPRARPAPAQARSHDEESAEDLVVRALAAVGIAPDTAALSELPKGDGG